MNNHRRSTRPPRSFDRSSDAAGLGEIYLLLVLCAFLDSLGANANVLDDAVATPDLPFYNLALRHNQLLQNQQGPWNSSLVSTPRDKECQLQWQLLRWFIQKIDAYYQELQKCLGQDIPADLRAWLAKYRRSKDIRKAGLRTLGDISQKNTPVEFDEILCAIIVLRAIFDFTSKRNPFEGGVETAFAKWRDMRPWTQTNRETLDVVLKQLARSDSSSLGDARPAWPRDLSGSPVLGTGSRFTNPGYYPPVVNENSLSDTPTYGPSNYSMGMNLFASPLNLGFIPDAAGYSTLHSQTQAQTQRSSPYTPCGPESFVSFPIISDLVGYPQTPDPSQLYGSSQSYHQPETQAVELNQSIPFVIFMKFLEDFMQLGDLLPLFSRTGANSIHWSDLPATHNARAAATEVLMDAERSLFSPLENSLSTQDPLIQAIIPTTRSLASLGGLSSLTSMTDYMIHLSMYLLPTSQSCRDFARTVLHTCPGASPVDEPSTLMGPRSQAQNPNEILEQRLDQIERDFHGTYYPSHLLQPRVPRSRSYRTDQLKPPTIPSYASRSQLTPSIVDSSESNWQSALDNSPGTSTTYERYINSPNVDLSASLTGYRNTNPTPSISSTLHCEDCGKVYTGKHASSHLSRHKRSHREAERGFKCPYCDKVFNHTRTDNIRTHCRSVHGQELPGNGREFWASRSSVQPGPWSN
ncbi:hypothetical protein F4677DRAFT_443020 [Hypoxylon crocopeplum]|nr:hypothetical protein F4677DRAFT_443020 [Hypoxylon crocopeplum]